MIYSLLLASGFTHLTSSCMSKAQARHLMCICIICVQTQHLETQRCSSFEEPMHMLEIIKLNYKSQKKLWVGLYFHKEKHLKWNLMELEYTKIHTL
jgi:hypothetical protein